MSQSRDSVVVSFTQTLHTYQPILKLLAESFQLQAPLHEIEKELVQAAYKHVQANKPYTSSSMMHIYSM
jgi:MSHA biogenesis protein MshM